MDKTNTSSLIDFSMVDGIDELHNEKEFTKNKKLAEIIILNEEKIQAKIKGKKQWQEEKEEKAEQIRTEIATKTIFSDINSNSIYCLDEEDKIYKQITYPSIRNYVDLEFANMKYVTAKDLDSITNTFMAVYRANKHETDFKKIIDKEKLKVPFANGTLYVYKKDNEIKHEFINKHDIADLNIFKLNVDYSDLSNFKKDDSIFLEWIKTKFKTKNYYNFFMIYLADLLQPYNYSQTALFMWGAGGIGKNVFEEILKQNIEAKIGAMEVEALSDKFANNEIVESLINISNEISKRDVLSNIFNKAVSREKMQFQYKGKDVYTARPLAKWLIFANSPLKIDMTAGVRRRILSIEMEEKRIHKWKGKTISKYEFEKLMLEDKKGFTFAVIIGTLLLMKYDLDVKSAYDDLIGEGENEKLENYNDSPVHDFLKEYLVEDDCCAVLTRDLAEAYNYLVKETDNSIVAGAETLNIKKFMIELRKNKTYPNFLYTLDNAKRGLKKGTYLYGYKFIMEEDRGLQIENIENIDSIEFLKSEINKK